VHREHGLVALERESHLVHAILGAAERGDTKKTKCAARSSALASASDQRLPGVMPSSYQMLMPCSRSQVSSG
jgi:hypothetical protein